MKATRDITVEDLTEMIIRALTGSGWSPEEMAGYLAAQKSHGILRNRCPAWMRNSAAVWYCLPPAEGFGDKSPPVLDRKHRFPKPTRPDC